MSGHNGDNQDFRNIMNDVDFLEAQIMETMNASVEFEEHDREHQGMKVRSITLFPSIKRTFVLKTLGQKTLLRPGIYGTFSIWIIQSRFPLWCPAIFISDLDYKLCDAIIYAYKVRLIYLKSAGESKFI